MTDELKPCPFCGGEAPQYKYHKGPHGTEKVMFKIWCGYCGCNIERPLGKDTAAAWNARPNYNPAPEIIENSDKLSSGDELKPALVIIEGIKQFGLAPDGSDLRDIQAAIDALVKERDEVRAAKWPLGNMPDPLCGYSSGGVNVWGDENSIKQITSAFNALHTDPELRLLARHQREEIGKLHARVSVRDEQLATIRQQTIKECVSYVENMATDSATDHNEALRNVAVWLRALGEKK